MAAEPPDDIAIIGAGLRDTSHLTLEALDVIRGARAIFTSRFNPAMADRVRALNPAARLEEQEDGEYAVGAFRPEMYQRIAARVIDEALRGPRVVALHPGSATVVDSITQGVLDGAAAHGLRARIVPGVSCIETVLAEMGMEVASGLQVILAQNLVLHDKRLDPTFASIVIQPGYFDTRWFAAAPRSRPERFELLQGQLLRSFDPDQPLALVLTPFGGHERARVHWLRLGRLRELHGVICPFHTLFIPPASERPEDARFRGRIESWPALLRHIETSAAGGPVQQDPHDWFGPRSDTSPALAVESEELAAAWRSRRGRAGPESPTPGQLGRCHRELAEALLEAGELEPAEASYRAAAQLLPGDALSLLGLARVHARSDRWDRAQSAFEAVLGVDPRSAEAWCGLGQAHREQGDWQEAIATCGRGLALHPRDASLLAELGHALRDVGDLDGALTCYSEALASEPRHRDAVVGEALVQELRGQLELARAGLTRRLDGSRPDPTAAITRARLDGKTGRRAPAVLSLQALLATGALGRKERRLLHFTLGELLDGERRHEEAFQHFMDGNALKHVQFQPEEHARRIDDLIAACSAGRMKVIPAATPRSQLPIFIVGLPRSGTTLVEQILASHPQVHAAGELQDLPRLALGLARALRSRAPYPWCLEALDQAAADALARRYLARLHARGGAAARVTDKLPYNFLHLGLIAKLFPGAAIVHCVRDPMDTLVSCFFSDFIGVHPHAYRLEHLGHHHNDYARLMRHWREEVGIAFLDVRYERLLDHPEAVVRGLLDHCGLPWDERCLRFHESGRVAVTASNDQVRKPLYRTSVGRAQSYPQAVEILRATLDPAPMPEAKP